MEPKNSVRKGLSVNDAIMRNKKSGPTRWLFMLFKSSFISAQFL